MLSHRGTRASHEEALSLVRRVRTARSGWVYARQAGGLRFRPYKRCWAELRGSVLLLHVLGEQSARADAAQIARRTAPENVVLVNMKEVRLRSDTRRARLRVKRPGAPDLDVKCRDGGEVQKWHALCVQAAVERSVGLADFEILQQVGKGASGRVFLVRDRSSGEQLALKVIEKTSVYGNADSLRHALDERLVLEMATDHPFILNLRYAFQTARRLYLVTEYCDGGDLFDYLRKRGKPFAEAQGRRIAAEILLALEHIHALGVVYRDLKLENVLLDLEGHVRVADFGLSKMLGPPPPTGRRSGGGGAGQTAAAHGHGGAGVLHHSASDGAGMDMLAEYADDLGGAPARPPPVGRTASMPVTAAAATSMTSTFCGTREYVAPEMLSGAEYGVSVDYWAFGILLYEILCGRTPFYSKDRDAVYEKIESGPLRFPRNLSPDVVNLIRGLLDRNPKTRLGLGARGIAAIKDHAWFAGVQWDATYARAPHPDAIAVEQSALDKDPSFGSAVTSSDPSRQTNADALLDDDASAKPLGGGNRPDVFAMFVSTKKKATNIAGYTYKAPTGAAAASPPEMGAVPPPSHRTGYVM